MDKPSQTVLVTGGRGFIGRAVVKLLQREEYEVLSLDSVPAALPSASSGQALPANALHSRELQCDITDQVALQTIFEQHPVHAIVHLAAILPTVAQSEPVRATQINVQGSLNLLEMARRFGVRRFVFGSSVSIYGSCRMDRVTSETDRVNPEDLYGAAKLYVEQLGQRYCNLRGLEFVSLRIVRIVGPGADSRTSAWRSEIFEMLNAEKPAEIVIPYAGAERLLLAHVDDVAQMIVALVHAERLEHGVYNTPCESILVEELKNEIERLNANVHVKPGTASVKGNPYHLDAQRFEQEFGFKRNPIFDRLRQHASKSES